MGPRQPRRLDVVAEGGSDADDLVRRDLFALTRAAQHDPSIGMSLHDVACNLCADRRVVHGFGRVGADVDDVMPGRSQVGAEHALEFESGMVGTDADPQRSDPSGSAAADELGSAVLISNTKAPDSNRSDSGSRVGLVSWVQVDWVADCDGSAGQDSKDRPSAEAQRVAGAVSDLIV